MSRKKKAGGFRPCYTHPGWPAYVAADNAWSEELHRTFGKRAGDARYDERGKSTPALKALHRRRHRMARRAHILSKTIMIARTA